MFNNIDVRKLITKPLIKIGDLLYDFFLQELNKISENSGLKTIENKLQEYIDFDRFS